MTPLTATRSQSGPLSWVSLDDLKEQARRAKILERAKAGDEEALAILVNHYRIKTLVLDGRLLMGSVTTIQAKPEP